MFVVTRRLLGPSCRVSCHDGGHRACLVFLQFVVAMEVVGLVLSCLIDFVVTRKVIGLDSLGWSSRGGLHAHLVAFVPMRKSLGSSCHVRCCEEVVMLFIVIIKHPCRPHCLDVAIIVILLLSLLSSFFWAVF